MYEDYLTTEELWEQYTQRNRRRFQNLIISGGGSIRLTGKSLSHLDLRQVAFSEVDLAEANLDDAVFVEVAFQAGVNLQGASMQRVSLREVNWRDLTLTGVDLRGCNLMHAQLQRANFQGTNLQEANLTSANLRGANLSGADLRGAILGTAVLEEVIADATTRWPTARALQRVRLAPGMTIAFLTGQAESNRQAQDEEYLPAPHYHKGMLAVSQLKKAILKDWKDRPEQPEFRQAVVHHFKGQCAISGADVLEGLEAAHIIPYARATNEDKRTGVNGLLLRADLHRLFDAGRLTIDPDTMLVYLDEGLQQHKDYKQWHHVPVAQPFAAIPSYVSTNHQEWRENLRWRQLHYFDLIEGGKLFTEQE